MIGVLVGCDRHSRVDLNARLDMEDVLLKLIKPVGR